MDNTIVLDEIILDEDSSGKLVQTTYQDNVVIYRIKLTEGRVYIGQTRDIQARMIGHIARFGEELLSYKLLEQEAKKFDEINWISKYRDKLGNKKVVNVSVGSLVPELPKRIVTLWIEQTPTQKAISAYKYYVDQNAKGVKTSMGKVSEDFGVTRSLVDRAKQVFNLASPEVFDKLWSGGKLTLGANKPTDSLLAVINYYKLISDDIVNNSTGVSDDLTDAELAFIKEMVDNLQENHNNLLLRKLADTIHSRIK